MVLLPAVGMSRQAPACSLQVMHGALLGSAEVILALHAAGSLPTAALLRRAVAMAPDLDEARAFRGRGAELLRAGVCRCSGPTSLFSSLRTLSRRMLFLCTHSTMTWLKM